MNISDKGLELVKSFEGYHRRLPDGSCVAYRCPANVLTIGWGCTVGVREGMVWTAQQAEDALRHELARFEAAVTRLVTSSVNQNQFDALVSFAYNCGEGALGRSSLLKAVNAGNHEAAAAAFAPWNRGGGRVLPGLVRRRAAEAILYREPVAAPVEPDMPQAVDPPAASPEKSRIVATSNANEAVAVTTIAGGVGLSFAELLGYGGQILPLWKTYGLEAMILVLMVVAIGFATVKHFRRQDHATGKTTP